MYKILNPLEPLETIYKYNVKKKPGGHANSANHIIELLFKFCGISDKKLLLLLIYLYF